MSLPDRNEVESRLMEMVNREPHSAESLTLYALASTLAYPNGGCLFKLTKLQDLGEVSRQLAYSLMEILAVEGDSDYFFLTLKQKLDEVVRKA